MGRLARKNLDGKYYHVMVQGIGKEHVFPDDKCKGFYLAALKNSQKKYPVKILAFCVMGNHAHILLSVENIEQLSGCFKRANAEYARYYNRGFKRVGYVFRDRFKSQVIYDATQLVYCLAYIHNNPLEAGIVSSAEKYEYSSMGNYLDRKGLVDLEEASKYFDTSIENILTIMAERTNTGWLEHDDKEYEDKAIVFEEIKKRYNLDSKESYENKEMVARIVRELKERSGASQREIAELLDITREKLRQWSTPPSP